MSVVFPAPLGPISPVMRPRGTASVTPDKAFKPSNWTLTSRATKSKSPEVIETPFSNANEPTDLIFCVAATIVKFEKSFADIGIFYGSDFPSGPPLYRHSRNGTGFSSRCWFERDAVGRYLVNQGTRSRTRTQTVRSAFERRHTHIRRTAILAAGPHHRGQRFGRDAGPASLGNPGRWHR